MPRNIVGRSEEIQILDKLLASGKPEFLVVYGRRRVGKTFLLHEHLKNYTVFSFSGAYGAPVKKQLGNFYTEYIRITKGQQKTITPKDWSQAFAYLTDYLLILTKESGKRMVVFLDELPWLDSPKSGFVSALEYFWNQHASKMDNIMLVACGSVASWMHKKLLKSKGGLYNRVTATLKLEPFTLAETAEYCRHINLKLTYYQIVQLYMTMGGIPFYLNALSPGKSVVQLIDEICFSPNGLLANEYDKLYPSLFKHAENHSALVEALARHPYGMVRNQLLKASGLPAGGTFSRALQELIDNGFVIKLRPYQKQEKESIYRLMDMYSLFYLRFIRGNVSGSRHSWQQLSMQGNYATWCGYAYENVCLLHTKQILSKLGIAGTISQISSWNFKANAELPGAQIDILIDRKDGIINVCEVKFSDKEYIITKEYAAKMRQKIAVFQAATRTKKSVLQTLITTYPAIQNGLYLEQIASEVQMEDLFER